MGGAMIRVVVGILLVCCAVPSLATNYIVGDAAGWATNVDYSTWTSGKTFAVGDTLVFNYGGGHTVDEVNSADYSTCTVGTSISSDSSGVTSITLTMPGTHYFICGMLGHCASGMKLTVTTVGRGANTTTPLASSILPSADTNTSTTTPPPDNTTTTIPASPPPFDNTNTTIPASPPPFDNTTIPATPPPFDNTTNTSIPFSPPPANTPIVTTLSPTSTPSSAATLSSSIAMLIAGLSLMLFN